MNTNINVQRIHIEQLILSCFLNQNRSLPLDELEFKDIKLPFELFKASRTTKMIAKAIYNLQVENKPIDDLTVLCYIEKHAQINKQEFLEISCRLWVSFDTMNNYLKELRLIDKEEEKERILRGLM